MATEVFDGGERVQKLFDHLESQKTILSTCTDLYKSLTSHFSTLDESLSHQSQTLDSKIQSLQSQSHQTLSLLDHRERSLPDRLASLSAEIEARKQAVLSEFRNPAPPSPDVTDILRSLCRRMDAPGLLNFLVSKKRKESQLLNEAIGKALSECVDPPSLVLSVVEDFVNSKTFASGGGSTERRWACGVVVGGLFPPDELKKKTEGGEPFFAGRTVQRALDVAERWKEKLEADDGVLNGAVGQAEVAMFLQLVIGFGLKEKFDEEFLKKLVLEFAAMKRFMPKLALPILEDKIGDIIDELVSNGKEIEAVYFAAEAGLIQRFQPASLLNNYLKNSKKNAADILIKGSSSSSSTDESVNLEMKSIKAVINCVGDLALEKQFDLNDLRKRLASLEKTKSSNKKKKAAPPAAANRPSKKRAHGVGGSRTSTQPASRPTKVAKISNSYPSSFAQRNHAPLPHQSPATRYHGAYNYPAQAAYETTPGAASYSSIYGGSQPQYSLTATNVGASGSHLGGGSSITMYGTQASYNYPYNLGAASVPAYDP